MPEAGADADLARGIDAFNAGRYAEAERLFSRAARAGADEKAAFFLAQARRALADDPAGFDADAETLRAAARAGDARAVAESARRLFARGKPRAFRALRDVWLTGEVRADARERSPWAAFLRSALAWRAGRDEAALAELARAARAPGFSWALYQSAEIRLRRLGRADAALADLRRVRRGAPWLWEAACLEAEIRAGRGEARALEKLRALQAPPASRAAFLAWRGALTLWTVGGREALEDLEGAADVPDGLGWRGAAKAHAGDLAGAESDLSARLSGEEDPEALCWRGEVLAATGRLAEAARDFERALAAAPGWFWARLGRALLRLDAGQEDAARADLRALAGDDAGRAGPTRATEVLREARRAARGLRRPDAHLQGAWLGAARTPEKWLAARLAPTARSSRRR
jgi:tetratricopeptide (TPR) repeat protein